MSSSGPHCQVGSSTVWSKKMKNWQASTVLSSALYHTKSQETYTFVSSAAYTSQVTSLGTNM